jgi:triphosphoribosyl-dephospho-CoA synthase
MPPSQAAIGSLAQTACTWEVLARKAGNVCPGREFPDLRVADFLASADAIAPILEEALLQPLGITILRCIHETRKVVNTNTNLGIVLLLAPLASVPQDKPLRPGVADVLARTTVDDSRNAYAAIRLAQPGGLGQVPDQDVRDEPTLRLRDVMALAQDRDLIAAQFATDFALVLDLAEVALVQSVRKHGNIERSIIELQLYLLSRKGDDLIRRKLADQAGVYRELADKILDGLETPMGRRAYLEFDAYLRADNHARNPGTTADLIAAVLFVALRENMIALTTPFMWDDHPFASAPI